MKSTVKIKYLKAINISTELEINNKKNKKYKQDRRTKEIVPRKYHYLLDMFEKGEKMTVPLHRPGVNLDIELEEKSKCSD